MFFFLQSYWDWLPLEIQEYILSFVWWQSMRDNKNPWKENVLTELTNYHALKDAWKPGHIHISHHRCRRHSYCDCLKHCPNNLNMDINRYYFRCDGKSCIYSHSFIWGMYTMVNRQNGEINHCHLFLGHSFPEAFERLNISLDVVAAFKEQYFEFYF